MIFNMSGGGIAALNFKVVGGTTAPANPQENTIWVNTSAGITSWNFNSLQPTGVEGMVWISIGTSSSVEFNSVKNNSGKNNVIMIYPLAAKQYISGVWIDKTAMSYQNGVWADWVTHLYNTGNKCESLTGGWSASGWAFVETTGGNGRTLAPTITWNSDHFVYNGTGDHDSYTCGGRLFTANDVDLTNVKTIRFHVLQSTVASASGKNTYAYIGAFKRSAPSISDSSAKIAFKQINSSAQESWYDIDVSNVTGSYAIGIAASSQSRQTVQIKIDRIYIV